MKTIKKSIVIHAPNAKVWNILVKNKYNQEWFAEFSEGSHAQTDWEIGSKAIFTDSTGGGLVAKITDNKLNQMLAMEYTGVVIDGKEDLESEEALKYKGGKEIYVLSEKSDDTQLDIASDMSEEAYEEMSAKWDTALKKIKELAEK